MLIKRVREQWIASYFLIFTVPMLFSIAIYFFSSRIIVGNTREIYSSSLEQIKNDIDNQLVFISKLQEQLAINSNVTTLSVASYPLSPENQFVLYLLVRDLRHYQIYAPWLDDVMLSLNRNGTVAGFNGHMTLELYNYIFFENDKETLNQLQVFLHAPEYGRAYKINDKIFFLRQINSEIPGSYVIAMAISQSGFEQQYLINSKTNGSVLYITDRYGGIICGTEDADTISALELLQVQNPDRTDLNYGGREYFLLYSRSGVSDWQYHYLIPIDYEKTKARQIQIFTLGGFLICLILGILFTHKAVKNNYDPIQKLISLFQQNTKKMPGHVNEISWMETEAGNFFREYRNIRSTMDENFLTMKKYFIYSLYDQPFDPSRDNDEMERYSINWKGNNFMVLLFRLAPVNPVQVNINLVRYMLMKKLEQYSGNDFILELTDAGPDIAAIANWSSGMDEPQVFLENAIEETQKSIMNSFSHSVLAGLGGVHQGPEGIFFSGIEAREALNYPDENNRQNITSYQDVKFLGTGYQYPLEIEQKLINTIRIGDIDGSLALFQQIIREFFPKGTFIKMFAIDMLGTFVRGRLSDHDPPLEGELLNLEQTLPRDYPQRMETLLREICMANRRILEEKIPPQLGEKIKEYINDNFRNPDLNVSITAYHFDLTPSYFSKIFRETTGLNMLEYITALRIEEAKKLILAGNSVNETALRCGYRESATFIRIFRKIAGVTPGQYKSVSM